MADRQAQLIVRDLIKRSQEGAIGLALRIQGGLVEETPVLTGWAASNWIPQVGTPFIKVVGLPTDLDQSKQTQGEASVLAWKFNQGPLHITNNVSYIRKLNEGSSKKAPAMFIESIVIREVAKANTEKLR